MEIIRSIKRKYLAYIRCTIDLKWLTLCTIVKEK